MTIKTDILKLVLLLLLAQTSAFAAEAFSSMLIEPFYNFYGENHYSVRGIGLGNTGVSYKNNMSGSLNNPATLSLDKKTVIELVYLGDRGKVDWLPYLYLDQDKANFLIGIGTRFTEKLTAGMTYSIEKNIQLRVDDIPKTALTDEGYSEIIGTADYIQEVEQSSFTAPISYQINTFLSLGLSLKYSNFKLKNTLFDTFSGSSDVLAFIPQLGVLFSPKNFMSLGLSYIPETKTFKGAMNYSNGASETVSAKTLPSSFGIGATLSPIDNLSASLEYVHRNYSKINDLDDQSSIRAGLEYHPIALLSLRLGYYSAPNYIKNPASGTLDSAQEFFTYGIGFNVNKVALINVSIRDSSIFKKGDINKSQYLANIQLNF